MNISTIDRLLDACADANSYPAKLLRSELFPYALQRYSESVNERASRVFSDVSESDYWRIRFYDVHDQGYPSTPHFCDSIGQLRDYLLQAGRKDPKCRHMFIRAPHSRAPLDCSKEMVSLAFTFHQVMAQFLDVVLHFGTFPGLNIPTAFHHCVFRHERFNEPSDAHRFSIPQLGRSGMEIKHCYNLWAVEKSSSTHGKRAPWEIRQAGLYHSLDLLNGKATWVHIKANKLLESRITEAYTSPEYLEPCDIQTVDDSFSATLMTHLIVFEWCGENWRQYLNHWECELERILITIRNAPIHKVERALVDVNSNIADILGSPAQQLSTTPTTRIGTIGSQLTSWNSPRGATFNSISPTLLQTSFVEKHVVSSLDESSQPTGSKPIEQNFSPLQSPITPNGQTDLTKDPFEVFDDFKYKDLQHLHFIGSKLHEADMIMKLDADILLEVVEYFKDFVNDSRTPCTIRDGCQGTLFQFVQRTNGIVRELEAQRTRISTLITLLNDGKALFDAITQFRNMELNRLSSVRMEMMTKDMHQSTLQMETIAGKTEKETSSMHIITLVTLLFLPGTFVAVRYALPKIRKEVNRHLTTNGQTFLGAGFYQWPDSDDASQIPDYPIWRSEYFFLFAKISFPLMALTLLFWAWPYLLRWISRRRSCSITSRKWTWGIRRQRMGDEEAQIASNNAHGSAGFLPRWLR
ncbi:hypothetical protein F5B22DRAFT_628666 [Xylaria bambusicola]|uniref:uncharacterized protein n=1 Tax=Xylaria bambusicola TaxID=326684 RepID=UPI002007879C|nr:uncharacterized protein F5B22DRAFT_628666 [Xylaria bambusicola]KAI0505225.1 hypothetical protein F5B22DRAFT_628666 [Xylaria bambusicola]